MSKGRKLAFALCFFGSGVLVGLGIIGGITGTAVDNKNYSSEETICGLGPGIFINDDAGEIFIPAPRKPTEAFYGFLWWKGLIGSQGFMAPPYPEIKYINNSCVPRQAFLNFIKMLRAQETHQVLQTHEVSCVEYWIIVRDSEGHHLFPAKGAPYLSSSGEFYWTDYEGKARQVSISQKSGEKRTVLWVTNPYCVLETIIDWISEKYNERKNNQSAGGNGGSGGGARIR